MRAHGWDVVVLLDLSDRKSAVAFGVFGGLEAEQ